jgi:hypothetical protein
MADIPGTQSNRKSTHKLNLGQRSPPTYFNKNIFYTEKAAILKVYFGKSLISQLLLGIFQKKFVDTLILTSSIHFWYQVPGKTSKFIQKNCKIWLFWHLHRQFPAKPEQRCSSKMVMIFGISILQSPRNVYSGLCILQKNLKIDNCVKISSW